MKNQKIISYLKSQGIVPYISPPYTQSFNGMAEAFINSLKDMSRAMHIQSHVCIELAEYSLSLACRIKNIAQHEFHMDSPYRRFHQREPDGRSFHTFGCLTISFIPKQKRTSQGNKGTPGIFLDFAGESLFRIFLFDIQKVVVRSDVDFFDEKFPGAQFDAAVGIFKPLRDLITLSASGPTASVATEHRGKFFSAWDAAEMCYHPY